MKSMAFGMPATVDPADARDPTRDAGREAPALQSPEPMKRFTIDVPVSLHTRIKTQCAMRGAKMADILREILEREFPKT